MRYVTIGRHPFTATQKKLLMMAGLTEEAARIPQLGSPADAIKEARERNAGAIVVQALPMHLLAQLLQAAGRAGIPVYSFKMRTLATLPEGQACPPGTEVERPAEGGMKRCVATEALQRLKRIVVEAEEVARNPALAELEQYGREVARA